MASIFFCGDFVCCKAIAHDFLSEEVKNLLYSNDLKIINFEAPILNVAAAPFKKAGVHLHQHEGWEQLVNKDALFNLCLLANNHIMDYGEEGLVQTIDTLKKNQIQTLGASTVANDIYQPYCQVINSIPIAIINAGEAQFGCAIEHSQSCGYAWVQHKNIRRQIIELKKQNYFVIVCSHAGLENEHLPLPEWKSIYHEFIDLGADFIVGHHPHFVQGKEIYKGKYIYYSLGNFFFPFTEQDDAWYKSLGVQLIIGANKQIEVKEYFFESKSDKVQIDSCSSRAEEFLQYSQAIIGAEYLSQIEQICLKHWREYYYSYFAYPQISVMPTNLIKKILRHLLEKIKNRFFTPFSQLLLYHNIHIETHRFVVERALQHINKTF
jgi:hypothetical protein